MKHKQVGEFGKRWDERVPRAAISWLVGRFHVGTSDEDIEKAIRVRIATSPDKAKYTESLTAQSVAYALECHRHNQKLYNDVVRGRI